MAGKSGGDWERQHAIKLERIMRMLRDMADEEEAERDVLGRRNRSPSPIQDNNWVRAIRARREAGGSGAAAPGQGTPAPTGALPPLLGMMVDNARVAVDANANDARDAVDAMANDNDARDAVDANANANDNDARPPSMPVRELAPWPRGEIRRF
jgi:hypothetical protein